MGAATEAVEQKIKDCEGRLIKLKEGRGLAETERAQTETERDRFVARALDGDLEAQKQADKLAQVLFQKTLRRDDYDKQVKVEEENLGHLAEALEQAEKDDVRTERAEACLELGLEIQQILDVLAPKMAARTEYQRSIARLTSELEEGSNVGDQMERTLLVALARTIPWIRHRLDLHPDVLHHLPGRLTDSDRSILSRFLKKSPKAVPETVSA